MDKYLVSVGDVFGVEQRLKEIDEGYRVFYNKAKHRYEVHNVRYRPNSLVLVSPYSELDSRLVRLVRSSRTERAKDIFLEVEEHNEKILKKHEEEKEESRKALLGKLEKMKKALGGE